MKYRKAIALFELVIDNENIGRISPAMATMLIQGNCIPAGENDDKRRRRLSAAFRCAIETDLLFNIGDMRKFSKWKWLGVSEDDYTTACESGNRSACLSYEHYTQRKPLILEGRRLHVGSEFVWNDRRWKATSFSKRGGLNATRTGTETNERLRLTWEMLHPRAIAT